MKIHTILAVSAMALISAAPAMANEPGDASQTTGSVKKDVQRAWKDIKQDSSQVYENIKATLIDDKGVKGAAISINPSMTAKGMIGKPVTNASGERVGTLKDIILDRNGKATTVIVADGEFPRLGGGKLAAFDYSSLIRVNADGDAVMPLTEASIDKAVEFSYDQKDQREGVRVLPKNSYSAAALLDADLVNPNNDDVADVENIYLKNGRASNLIVSFNEKMGMGGERAALNYASLKLVPDGKDFNFQLSAAQTAQFETYKKAVTN